MWVENEHISKPLITLPTRKSIRVYGLLVESFKEKHPNLAVKSYLVGLGSGRELQVIIPVNRQPDRARQPLYGGVAALYLIVLRPPPTCSLIQYEDNNFGKMNIDLSRNSSSTLHGVFTRVFSVSLCGCLV